MARQASQSVFDTAPIAPKPAKKTGSKLDRIAMPESADYAAIVAMEKMLKTAKSTLGGQLEVAATELFLDRGLALKSTPENVVGFEGDHTATLIFGMRGAKSPLSDGEAELLDGHNIPYVTEDETVETFIINPAYLSNAKVMKRVAEALAGVKDLPDASAPDGAFILKQPGVSKRIANEATVAAIFSKPRAVCAELISVVTQFSIRSKFKIEGTDLAPLLGRVNRVLGLGAKGKPAADDDE